MGQPEAPRTRAEPPGAEPPGAEPPGAEPSGFFVLRTPMLPLATVTDWGAGLEAPLHGSDRPGLESAVAADRIRLRARLEELVTDPGFREAVFLASPSLEAAIDSWRKDPDSERGQRAESSLVAYLMRAATRPTPFGLFAGCTTGRLGPRTRLRLAGRDAASRHTRLDMDYLWALAKAIEADPALRSGLRYWPNSSLYQIGDRLLYAEARDRGAGRSYHLTAADITPYLTRTLSRAIGGEYPGVLARALTSEDISPEEATAYIAELVDSQLLVPETQPLLTGAPAGRAMTAILSAHAPAAGIGNALGEALDGLAAIDAAGWGASPDAYRRIASGLAGLPAAPDLARFVQVDLVKTAADATLSGAIAQDMRRGVQILHRLATGQDDVTLASFREQFTRRYETREMPLAEVLDEETGIGFSASGQPGTEGGPLLAGLPLHPPHAASQLWARRDTFLYRKLTAALAAGQPEISIDPAEADGLGGSGQLPLPAAFDAVGVVIADSPDAVAAGRYQVLVNSAGGPSGARLLGRFCHADDELHELVLDHLRAEERARPDCIFAEVVHLPQGRTGNILSRPVLREYEIPYLGRSGAPGGSQLPVSDLLVSVQDDRIVLRSRRLGREVIPRLSAAHNYASRGLATYRFLCALQHQGVSPGVIWDWGPLLATPFLPRVISGRAVLSRATWNLGPPELAAFTGPRGAGLFAAVSHLRARLSLPRWVALADADNELVTDLDNVLCVEALARQVRRRRSAALVELLPRPDQLCVSGPEGRYAHQIIVPFVQPGGRPAELARPAAERPRAETASPAAGGLVRRFPPGTEWLYLKLFTGNATADRVLLGLAPVLSALAAAGSIDSWHFIRFGDPDWHVRLRLHGDPDALLREVLPRLRDRTQPLLQAGVIWRIQLDTYEREVERYGGPDGIALAERVFWADSAAVLAIMRLLPGDAGAEVRWRVALRGMDQLFDDLGLTLAGKRALARAVRQGYGREFGIDGAFQRAVGARFRQERAALESVLAPPGAVPGPSPVADCLRVLGQRSAAIAEPAARLRSLPGEHLAGLATSLAHMHVNRLLRSTQRAQEFVLYEMLDRLYASQAARGHRPAGEASR
jgi:thiopeptide-type bacteriocin biosynthesis protein